MFEHIAWTNRKTKEWQVIVKSKYKNTTTDPTMLHIYTNVK